MTNEMTVEEAIKQIKENCYFASISEKTKQALDKAIKALEQQPTDAVSREEVLDVIKFEDEWLFDAKSHNADTKIAFSAIKSKISELPPVTPQIEPCEDCISREAVNALVDELARAISDERCCISRGRSTATIMRDILQLPPVSTQRKMGKWIFNEKLGHQYCCSECGNPMPTVNDYYRAKLIGCPYCLADMREGNK